MRTRISFLVNACEVLHHLDDILNFSIGLQAASVRHLEALDNLHHLLAVQVKEGLNQVAIDKTLQRKDRTF